jgi:predicted transcriptional regulator YheO
VNKEPTVVIDPPPSRADLTVHDSIARDLLPYVPVVDFLAAVLGDDTEVLLHDVRDVNHSIVVIAHGQVSGRSIGGPATDLVLQILNSDELSGRTHVANYHSRSRSGVTFKSHTLILRGRRSEIIGMICVNSDLRKWIQARELLAAFTRVDPLGADEGGEREQLGHTAEEVARSSIDRRIAELGVEPALMSQDDREKLVERLHADGVFLLKGTIREVAEILGVSETTVYRLRTRARRTSPSG